MTKYFLHGGRVGVISKENEVFFHEILQNAPHHANILIMLFAREKPLWDKKYLETCSRFQSVAGGKKLYFECAQEDTTVLQEQIKKSDIIFIHGGDTQRLQKKLREIPDLEKLFEGKIVAGSSAGTLVFMNYYYENDTGEYYEGLGIFDMKCICHWKDHYAQSKILKKLSDPSLKLLLIPEGTYVTREK